MGKDIASEARFIFEIGGDSKLFRVYSFEGTETVSELYDFTLELAMEGALSDDFQFEPLLGEEASLRILSDDEDRFVHGIVNEITLMGETGRFTMYKFRLAPKLWLLTLRANNRIFQKKKVKGIIQDVLSDAGIPGDRFRFALKGSYQEKEYCVQYGESDFDFISRLMEEEGIFYFFEHEKNKHVLVITDSNVGYQPIGGDKNVSFHVSESLVPELESIFQFAYTGQTKSGKASHTDYNFKKPSLNLLSSDAGVRHSELEQYEYPGKYVEKSEGKRRASVRLNELTSFESSGGGTSFCPRLTPGYLFELDHHPSSTLCQEYVLMSVTHRGKQPQVLEEYTSSQEYDYYNKFLCLDKDVTFRPKRVTPKVIIHGLQTAIVVGPKSKKSYLDDENYGMIKVQFHWDRKGTRDEHSTCWLRVAYPYAGEKHGMQFTPLVGDEVLVGFLEGDPDRPVIVGSLFKGDHKALVKDEEMIKNQILTPYKHKLTFSDKGSSITLATGGGETIFMGDGDKNKSDDGNNIKISTADGHYIHLLEGKKGRGVIISTLMRHQVILDDGHNDIEIVIKDQSNNLSITMNSASEEITIANKGSGKLILNAQGEIWIQSKTKILMEAPDIQILASKYAKLSSPGATDIKGNPIKLNC